MTSLATASGSIDIRLFDSMSAAETIWRDLESRAVVTPYQRYDWLNGLFAAGAESDSTVAIAVLSRDNEALALLPLALRQKPGLRLARIWGTEYSNVDWITVAQGFQPGRQDLLAILSRIGQEAGGIDLLTFQNLPTSWDGTGNLLLQFKHGQAASNFYWTSIAGTEKPFIGTRLAPKSRSDLKRSRRRMDEAMGPVELVRVNDAALLEQVHAAFIEQRRDRFDEMGVDNIFENDIFRRFFQQAALEGFEKSRPALVAHALMANGKVAATCWGTTAGDHYSLYINSTDTGEASKFRLMSILIADLMDELLDMGIKSFDLGLGDFSYKERWTDPQPVFDCAIPLTAVGRVAALGLSARTTLKRTIKQNPRLWETARQVRRAIHRMKPSR